MATYTYSIVVDFHGRPPNIPDLKLRIIASTISQTLQEIYVSGDRLDIVFAAALSPADQITLNSLVSTAKYYVDIYSTYDNLTDVKALLWNGPITLGPRPFLSVNSATLLAATEFLTPSGINSTESNAQFVVGKKGTLCNFTTVVVHAVAVGTRTITVRVNGVPTTLSNFYPATQSGVITSPNTVDVNAGDLVSIQHVISGILVGSNILATVNIL